MNKVFFIGSLHRPFSQQLKTTKWVCDYISKSKTKISSSNLNLGFYFYLINLLRKEYHIEIPSEYNGLPSFSAISNIYEYAKTKTKSQFLQEIPKIIKSRKTPLEKQIYSTYKAASYYVNLAKDKFGLIDEKNRLTYKGENLVSFRSNFFKLSTIEKEFFFVRILEVDFHLFITLCLFQRLEKQYKLKHTIEEQLEFIDKFLMIRHFNFTSSSLENYNTVRTYWADTLGVISKTGTIKRKYLAIIDDNENFKLLYAELIALFSQFEKVNFKTKKDYLSKKSGFINNYKQCLKGNVTDLGFINLYDIKKSMHISQENFQAFLSDFYENEKNNYNIFFSNTVNSIDRRARFSIRNRPVIKIKIK